jgi:breast cancer 2 susceptibility protein
LSPLFAELADNWPPTKKQRLSLDMPFVELSQEDWDLDSKPSQGSKSPINNSQGAKKMHSSGKNDSNDAGKENIGPKSPCKTDILFVAEKPVSGPTPLVSRRVQGGDSSSTFSSFCSNSSIGLEPSQERPRSPSPEVSPERDYSSWFEPAPALPAVGFQTAHCVASSTIGDSIGDIQTFGFRKASDKGWVAPSAAALAAAQEKMKSIWQEGDSEYVASYFVDEMTNPPFRVLTNSPSSPNTAESFFQLPESPSPATFGQSSFLHATNLSSFSTASSQLKGKGRIQPFKPPSMIPPSPNAYNSPTINSTGFIGSPLNPKQIAQPPSSSFTFQHPQPAASSTPGRQAAAGGSAFVTPVRPSVVGRATRGMQGRPKFVTPFKAGMRPGEPGRKALEDALAAPLKASPMTVRSAPEIRLPPQPAPAAVKSNAQRSVFDLSK